MNRKIRVLQVIPSLCPGGAERMVIHLVRGLDPSRYTVEVVSLADPAGTDLEQIAAAEGITVTYLGKRPGFDPRVWPRFDGLLSRIEPDVVHIHLNALLYAAPPALRRGVPAVVYTAHNFPDLLVPTSLGWFYRWCFRHGVVPVSISRNLTPALRIAFGVDNLPLIPNGIPVAPFRHPRVSREDWRRAAGFSDTDFLFVCVARLSPQKNHDLLLRAFVEVAGASPRPQLLLAGDGELREPLTRLAEELNIPSRVHFLGNRSDVPEMLAACDVFTLASSQEANPLCVMEAMAAGLPVVCTRVGGVPELVGARLHGLLVEPGDADGLAQAMSAMMFDSVLRAACGCRAAARAVEEFDVPRMAAAYDALYRRLLAVEEQPLAERKSCLIQSESHI